jgi:5-formyltetrahydrofolate cyclo-ligase
MSPTKHQLRRELRAAREARPSCELALASVRICDRVAALPAFEQARSVALYAPMLDRAEVDVRGLDARARAAGKLVYYPFVCMTPPTRGFRRVDAPSELRQRGRPFAEPDPSALLARRGDIDLFVVPALAAAPDGHRLGQGAGYYDAVLDEFCPPARSVVVVYDGDLLESLPIDTSDRRCDWVVTETRALAATPAAP